MYLHAQFGKRPSAIFFYGDAFVIIIGRNHSTSIFICAGDKHAMSIEGFEI